MSSVPKQRPLPGVAPPRRSRRIPRWLVGLLVGAAATLLALLLRFYVLGEVLERLERLSYDRLVRATNQYRPVDPSPVLIVGIDPASERKLGPFPWPRSTHAQLIRELKSAGARVIAFDVLFVRPGPDPHADAELADATRKAGNVVWQSRYPDAPGKGMEEPLPQLLSANPTFGFANMAEDPDRVVRSIPALHNQGKANVAPFSVVVIQALQGRVTPAHLEDHELLAGSLRIPLDSREYFLLPYIGKAGTVKSISYADVLGGLPPGFLENKIVLVGRNGVGREDLPIGADPGSLENILDLHRTPYTDFAPREDNLEGRMFGVELQAQAVLAELDHRMISPLGRVPAALMLLLLSLSIAWITTRLSPGLALPPVLGCLAIYVAAVIYLFVVCHTWTEMHTGWVAAVLSYGGVVISREFLESRELRRTVSLFSRYVAPKVARRLLEDPDAVVLGMGRVLDVTVLFCDIRGFTSRSETLSPQEVLGWLSEHLEAMVEVIHAEDGTIDKYVGDAIMAVFGAPETQPDHAARAVRAARAMSAALDQLNSRRKAAGSWTYEIGIGLHSGPAVTGSMGHHARPEYAILGDTVNTASRIESLTKQFHTRILISEETLTAAGAAAQPAESVGDIEVRGRSKPVQLYKV